MSSSSSDYDILVVEDEEDIRFCIKEILEDEGYSVALASNGKEALDILEKKKNPRVIFLDLMMPIMNGTEFIRTQQAKEDFSQVPVVIMSADREIQRKTQEMAASTYLAKPIDLDALLAMAAKYCS
jgi:CheY-like chemotaxis protein